MARQVVRHKFGRSLVLVQSHFEPIPNPSQVVGEVVAALGLPHTQSGSEADTWWLDGDSLPVPLSKQAHSSAASVPVDDVDMLTLRLALTQILSPLHQTWAGQLDLNTHVIDALRMWIDLAFVRGFSRTIFF